MVCYSCKKTHSVEDEVRWRDRFNVEPFFSHIAPWIHAEFELPFLKQIKLQLKKKTSDTEGKFFKLEVEIAGENFVFRNLHSANTESKQVKTFKKLFSHMKLLNLDERSQTIFVEDFDSFFNSQLEAVGRNPGCIKNE